MNNSVQVAGQVRSDALVDRFTDAPAHVHLPAGFSTITFRLRLQKPGIQQSGQHTSERRQRFRHITGGTEYPQNAEAWHGEVLPPKTYVSGATQGGSDVERRGGWPKVMIDGVC